MQKKHILLLILLAFAVSMELVLLLHLLTQSAGSLTGLSQSARATLASTITVKIAKHNQPPADENQPGDLSTPVDPAAGVSPNNEHPFNVDPGADQPTLDAGSQPPQADGAYPYPAPGAQVPTEPEGPEPADSGGFPGGNPNSGGYLPPEVTFPTDAPPSGYPAPETPTRAVSPTSPNGPTATVKPQAAATATSTRAPGGPPNPTAVPSATAPSSAAPSSTASATAQPQPQPQPEQTVTLPAPTRTRTPPAQDQSNLLVAVAVQSAPKLDGAADDAAWANAPALNISTHGGANHSATQVTLKAVYDQDRVYFLLRWADPTQSLLRSPWEKQKDGSWKRLVGPNTRGNDETVFSEDQLALLWPINNSIPNFASSGCGGLCHSGENASAKPYGNMYTAGSGQGADLWQWEAARNPGQVDDQYLNSARYAKDNPSAGFHPDPGGGGYRANLNEKKNGPAYMPPDGGAKNGTPGYILDAEKVLLAAKLFKTGERVPAILVAPFNGDRGDISARWRYAGGAWTLEISRKRVTGSDYDVQFKDLSKIYAFTLATFDNAQVRHAVEDSVYGLKFQP